MQSIVYFACLAVGMLFSILSTIAARIKLALCGAEVGTDLRINGALRLRVHPQGKLVVGSNVRINSGVWPNPVGGMRTSVWEVGRAAVLRVGNGVGLSNVTIVCKVEIEIGDNTLVGGGCAIYDSDFHPLLPEERLVPGRAGKAASVKVGPNVFLGTNCILLKGVKIGEGAVIGAGAVVSCDVPAFEVWAGNPARRIRSLKERPKND